VRKPLNWKRLIAPAPQTLVVSTCGNWFERMDELTSALTPYWGNTRRKRNIPNIYLELRIRSITLLGQKRKYTYPMKRQRVLFVDLGSHYGGVETYIEGLAGILGPYLEGYAVCSLPALGAKLRAQGITVVCLPLLGSKWFKALRLLLGCFVVPYMVLRFRTRTVQVNGYFESLLLGPLRLLGCKTIYTMHGPFETELYTWFRNPARFFPRALSKQSVRFASQVVCVSETVGGVARSILPRDKVRVISNWVHPPSSFRRTFSINKRPQLLFVGRLEEYKGVQFILEAMRQIPDVSLVVVGDGTYRTQLEAAAHHLDVHFAGFQPDPSRFYEDSSVFIHPSSGPEGCSLAAIEAMAHGLPCVLSDLTVHREMTADGKAAALFTRGDSESLAQQLKHLLNDEDRRQSYGLAGRQQVEQNYSLARATQQYMRTFGLWEPQQGSAIPSLMSVS
jgi:glycosyltransferase involved in cell wall biosynthesis